MKRMICLICVIVLLTGCGAADTSLERAMTLRSGLLNKGAAFDTVITADYGDKLYTFGASCTVDNQGALTFTVTQPETISGITGTVSASGGKLTFGDKALAFPMLADGQVTPVSAPWLLMKTLRSGYLTSCAAEGDGLRLSIDDSYHDDALHLDIWLSGEDVPIRGEILWQGRRILSMEVKNFTFV